MRAEVKFAEGSDTRLRVLAIPFGGPDYLDGKDFDGEFFSERTDLCPDWYTVTRPLLYHHGLHPDTDVRPVGKVDSTSATVEDGVGVWVEAELDKQAQYYEHIRRLVEKQAAYASSGSMPHLVRKGKDGHIDCWPWVELSLTTTPANPLARVEYSQVKAHYKAAGITPPPSLSTTPIDSEDALTYLDHLDRVTDEVEEVIARTHRVTEGRMKVGRPLSEARRQRLFSLMERMQQGVGEIEALLRETETAPKPEERGGTSADPPDPPTADAPADGADTGTAGGTAEGEAAAGKAAGHAPSDVLAIFAKFEQDTAFYGEVLPLHKRTA